MGKRKLYEVYIEYGGDLLGELEENFGLFENFEEAKAEFEKQKKLIIEDEFEIEDEAEDWVDFVRGENDYVNLYLSEREVKGEIKDETFVDLCKQLLNFDITKAQEEVHTLLCKHIFNEDIEEEISEANICISLNNNDVYVVNYNSNKRELTVVYDNGYDSEIMKVRISDLNKFHLLDIIRHLI